MAEPALSIWTVVDLPGLHHWPGSPSRAYLRDPHRHLFRIRVEVAVTHDDRDIEFHDLQQVVRSWWGVGLPDWGPLSCEGIGRMLAEMLCDKGFKVLSVDVSEDGESGATLRMEPSQ